jgi:hypothetical protein
MSVKPIDHAEAKTLLDYVQEFNIPVLITPTEYVPRIQPGSTDSPDCAVMEKQDFRVVFSGVETFVAALISIVLIIAAINGICYLTLMGLGNKFEFLREPSWLYSIMFFVTGMFFLETHQHLWIQSDAQKAKLFTSNLPGSKDIVVYLQGFSLKPWWHSVYKACPEIDFQKTKTIPIECKLRTLDGIDVTVKITTIMRSLKAYIHSTLMFEDKVVEERIKAVITDRLSRLVAMNTWETLFLHQNDVVEWVSLIFKGEDEVTPFEQAHGRSVSRPQISDIDPSEAGKALVDMTTKTLRFAQITRQIRAANPDMEPGDVLRSAFLLMGIQSGITESKITIRAPEGVRTVALDNDGQFGRIN